MLKTARRWEITLSDCRITQIHSFPLHSGVLFQSYQTMFSNWIIITIFWPMYRLQAILCKARGSGVSRQFPPKASWAVFGQLLIIMIKNVATQMLNTLMIDWTPGSILPVQSFPGHVRWLCVSRSDCREHLVWWWWWWRFIQRVALLISIYRQIRDVLFPDPPLRRPELAPRQEQDVQEGVHQEHKRRCWCWRWY